MSRLGMDVDSVESTGRQLKERAQGITSIVRLVDALVNRADSHWWGALGRGFVNEWRTIHRPALLNAVNAIDGLGRSAISQAGEQRVASGPSGGALPGGPAGDWLAEGVERTQTLDSTLTSSPYGWANGLFGVLSHLKTTTHSTPYGLYGKLFDDFDFMRYNRSLQHEYSPDLAKFFKSGPMHSFDLFGKGMTVAAQSVNVYDTFLSPSSGSKSSGDRIEAGGEAIGSALKMSKNPVAYLVGANVTAWSMVGAEATKVDWSAKGMSDTFSYAWQNPGVVAEELGKAAKEMVTERIWKIFG